MNQVYSCQRNVTLILAKNILERSDENRLKVNVSKIKEPVFHRSNARNYLTPAELCVIERVRCAELLGV